MKVRKWNDNKKDYDIVEIPDDWKIPMLSDDMDEIINCVNCGREVKFGDCYTSMRYYRGAFGYNECPECHEEYYRSGSSAKKGELENENND